MTWKYLAGFWSLSRTFEQIINKGRMDFWVSGLLFFVPPHWGETVLFKFYFLTKVRCSHTVTK